MDRARSRSRGGRAGGGELTGSNSVPLGPRRSAEEAAAGGGGRGGGKGGRGAERAEKDAKAGRERKKAVSAQKREAIEIETLTKRIAEEAPAAGSQDTTATLFSELPLSRYTLAGLERGKFTKLTEIQRAAIPHILAGRDVLGAAKTGSGKTLAFVVPLLEKLFRQRWSADDGLGALIISPTRELAMQIMEVLAKVGSQHFALSCGLVCGGKDFFEEQERIGRMSILVATPGRLLQHLEQSPDLDCSGLQMLVLDEADRLLDMGFAEALNAILGYLPSQRQTVLFSATQTKSVKDLARLSLDHPEYVAVHESATFATPRRLVQTYVVCPLPDKINLLWSFIRSHLKAKMIVFLSAGKEVRFVYECFRRLRPGTTVLELHGKISQAKRMFIYHEFLKKPNAVLFATDLAARGLDFPSVDWVVQLDCPEDAATYIHRVGRTARFRERGNGLLVLLPSEAPAMVPLLEAARVPLQRITVNPAQALSIAGKVAAEVAADPHLKFLAQKAFVSYVRSVHLASNKEVFQLKDLPVDDFATSLGLPFTPRVKALRDAASAHDKSHKRKNLSHELRNLQAEIRKERDEKKKKKKMKKGAKGDDEDDEDSDDDDELRRRMGPGSDEDEEDEEDESEDDESEEDSSSDSDSSSVSDSDSDSSSDSSDSDSDSESDSDSSSDSDSDGGVFRKKKAAGGGGKGKAKADDDEDDDDEDVRPEDLVRPDDFRGLKWYEKEKLKKLTADTLDLGKRRVAKDDGFLKLAAEKGGDALTQAEELDPAEVARQMAEYTARVKARVKEADAEDKEHDRERVRKKHRDERRRAKGLDLEEEAEEEEEAEDEEVEEEEEEEEEESGEEEESEDEEEEEEEEEAPVRSKRSRPGAAAVGDAEAMALALLAKKRRTEEDEE